jgi:hypothetical protein
MRPLVVGPHELAGRRCALEPVRRKRRRTKATAAGARAELARSRRAEDWAPLSHAASHSLPAIIMLIIITVVVVSDWRERLAAARRRAAAAHGTSPPPLLGSLTVRISARADLCVRADLRRLVSTKHLAGAARHARPRTRPGRQPQVASNKPPPRRP